MGAWLATVPLVVHSTKIQPKRASQFYDGLMVAHIITLRKGGEDQAGLRGSRQLKGRKAALVLVAVEKRGRASGRARMAVIPDFKSSTVIAFLK